MVSLHVGQLYSLYRAKWNTVQKFGRSIPECGVVVWAIDERSIDGFSKPGSSTLDVTAGLETSMSTVDWLLTGLALCVDLIIQPTTYLNQLICVISAKQKTKAIFLSGLFFLFVCLLARSLKNFFWGGGNFMWKIGCGQWTNYSISDSFLIRIQKSYFLDMLVTVIYRHSLGGSSRTSQRYLLSEISYTPTCHIQFVIGLVIMTIWPPHAFCRWDYIPLCWYVNPLTYIYWFTYSVVQKVRPAHYFAFIFETPIKSDNSWQASAAVSSKYSAADFTQLKCTTIGGAT